jgi:hypothetical protein
LVFSSLLAGGDYAALMAQLELNANEQRARDEEMAHRHDQMAHKVEEQHRLSTLTPSGASHAGKDTYDLLLNDMHISVQADPTVFSQQAKKRGEKQKNFQFSWDALDGGAARDAEVASVSPDEDPDLNVEPHAASSAREKLSYAPLFTYLRSVGQRAFVIAHGKNVGSSRGLLFDRHAHSMRLERPNVSGQLVSSLVRVKGRSDLAVIATEEPDLPFFSEPGHQWYGAPQQQMQQNCVEYVIEVKDTKEGKLGDAACREAVTQLIGLNLSNPYHSPKVLLTNLVGSHQVYYMVYNDAYPWYCIRYRRCSTILAAIQFLAELRAHRRDLLASHFGRSTTPVQED